MIQYWKILIIVGGVLVVLGGIFWYAQVDQAQTVFESAPGMNQAESKVSAELVPEEATQEIAPENAQEASPSKESPVQQAEAEQEKTPLETKNESQDMEPKKFSIKSALVSFGYESASGRKIDTIVLHSSYSPSGDPYSVSAVKSLWQSYGVAPHYMVARDGTVYQLVADKDIAYHAGESTMKDGRKNVNDFSIGVEILNTKDDEYTKAQYQAVSDLIAYLKGKHSIKSVVGHDDIAPGRKTDPWNFNWNKL